MTTGRTPDAIFEMALTDNPSTVSPTFTDLTDRLRTRSIKRGRSSEFDRFEAGTSSHVLDNRDSALNPENTASALYPLKPIRRIRHAYEWAGVEYDAFHGITRGFPQDFPHKDYDAVVNQQASDLFLWLSKVKFARGSTTVNSAISTVPALGTIETITVVSTALPMPQAIPFLIQCGVETMRVNKIVSSTQYEVERGAEGTTVQTHAVGDTVDALTVTFAQAKSGTRVSDVLSVFGLTGALIDVEAGVRTITASDDLTGQSPLEHLLLVAEAEGGRFFAGKNGKATFHDLHHLLTVETVSRGTFGPWTSTSATSPKTAVLADSPGAFWRLNEPSGRFFDTSGHDVRGTPAGTITRGASAPMSDGEKGITLDGSTGYFTAPDGARTDLGDVFTLEAWVKVNALGGGLSQTIFSKGTGAYLLDIGSGGALRLQKSGTGVTVASTANITAGAWYHIAATKNGSTVKLYINGVDVTGTVTNATYANTSTALFVGRRFDGANSLAGSIASAAIYPTALSAARVAAHYAARTYGALPYTLDGVVDHDETKIYNIVRITAASGNVFEARDQTSINDNLERAYERTWPILDIDAEAAAPAILAQLKDAPLRVPEITIEGVHDPAALWPTILGFEIGQRYAFQYVPRGGGDPILRDMVIDGIQIDSRQERHVTKLQLTPITLSPHYWHLGSDPLGTDTVLAPG